MKQSRCLCLVGLLAVLVAGHNLLQGSVTILSMVSSRAPSQPLGTPVTWTVTAADTNAGPVAFQFNVEYVGQGSLS